MFDDNVETVCSLRKGLELARQKWLASLKLECHLIDKKEIIDGTKIWTDSDVESSTLFEVPRKLILMRPKIRHQQKMYNQSPWKGLLIKMTRVSMP